MRSMAMAFLHIIENTHGFRSVESVDKWLQAERPAIKAALDANGAVLFRGFPIKTAEDFDQFACSFNDEPFTYNDSLSNAVRVNLTPRVFTANEAPPDVEIYLHHEMAQTPVYPSKLYFCCLSAAEYGGATPLCRSDLLYESLKAEHPEWAAQFEGLGLQYTTHMPADDDNQSGQGRSWRSTLSVRTQTEAEAKLLSLEYTWQWQDDGSLIATTPALPAVKALPDGSESFFNQLIAAHRGWQRRDDQSKPVVAFGNGEEIPEGILNTIVELAQRFTQSAEWQDGDIAIVDNFRVMHGRYPFTGARKRQVVVSLAR